MPNPEALALPTEALATLCDLYNALRNADHLGELPFGQSAVDEVLNGTDWCVGLAPGHHAILRVNHNRPNMQGDRIDVTRVHRVQPCPRGDEEAAGAESTFSARREANASCFFSPLVGSHGLDDEGTWLSGPEQAKAMTVTATGKLLKGIDGTFWSGQGRRMHVTDETRATVCILTMRSTNGSE